MKTYKINIKRYPYGKITKTLEKSVVWLNKNMVKIQEKAKEQHKKLSKDEELLDKLETNKAIFYADCFDYPHYWGLSKSLRLKLNGDEVDFIQDETYEWWQE